jgi:putative membrane protein
MRRASQLFSAADRQAVATAVTAAERRTSGEIVPVVATVSGRYDRAEDLFGLVVALGALALAWLWWQDVRPIGGEWAGGHTLVLGLVPILLIVLLGFMLGTAAATYVPALRLPFIRRKEMEEEVERSAAAAFQRFRVRTTAGGTGILIYVSLYEHLVRVLGDDAIAAKLSQAEWDSVCHLVIDGLRTGSPAAGLTAAIDRCGELLQPHFPRQADDRDELGNELRLID